MKTLWGADEGSVIELKGILRIKSFVGVHEEKKKV